VAAVLAWATGAQAAGPLGAQGAPINTSAYTIDLFEGPVLSSSRVTGLAGAFSAIAEGVEGMTACAAAPAVRDPFSYGHFDYDASIGFTSAASLAGSDFDNNGTTGFTYRNVLFFTAGLVLQYGEWGFGVQLDNQSYRLGHEISASDSRFLQVDLTRGHFQVARRLLAGDLVVGVGIRTASLALAGAPQPDGNNSQEILRITGSGVEAGALWAPVGWPWRASLTVRSSVGDTPDVKGDLQSTPAGDSVVGGLVLPSTVRLPWEIEAGFAWQLGPRPLNVAWSSPATITPEQLDELRTRLAQEGIPLPAGLDAQRRLLLKRRYESLPRSRWLLSGSLLVSGPVRDAVGVESFLAQIVDRSGRHTVLTPRIGVETEPVEHWLKVRAGSYLEPSRFTEGNPRIHGTTGVELKLFSSTVFGLFEQGTAWRASGVIDLAHQYSSFSLSAGIWH
jgi:hypothetical protein